jgi:ABC-type phosphate/phosphonate transport system substrate-binding protein
MITKDRVKNEIDQMPDELVEKVYAFISDIKKPKKAEKTIHTYKLRGVFDRINIRKTAYE